MSLLASASSPALAQGGIPGLPFSNRLAEVRERARPKLTAQLEQQGLRLGAPIFIRIFKELSELEVWVQADSCFQLFRTYEICSFSGSLGPKLREGDGQAPEGFYYVKASQLNPVSDFHLSFDLGYPSTYDRRHGRAGGEIMVHGSCVSIGCFAMTDPFIEEIYLLAESAPGNGQPFFRVHVFPFRMTAERMAAHQASPWRGFWVNLRDGYDFFERTCRPPNVEVRGGKYVFEPA